MGNLASKISVLNQKLLKEADKNVIK